MTQSRSHNLGSCSSDRGNSKYSETGGETLERNNGESSGEADEKEGRKR
jgi:hypothetical protein